LAILQPTAYVGHPRVDYLKGELEGNLRDWMQPVYAILRRAARRTPWIYDLTSAFDRPDRLYIDSVHTTVAGNEIIARKVTRLLRGRRAPGA
jgi:hypothetical protein